MKKAVFIFGVLLVGLFLFGCTQETNESLSCLKAGEVYQSSELIGKDEVKCCDGLKVIPKHDLKQGDKNCGCFDQFDEETFICSACGDGVCDSWENNCNCPNDCSCLNDLFCFGKVPAKYHIKLIDHEGWSGEAWIKIEDKKVEAFSRIEKKDSILYQYITVDKNSSDKSEWTRTYFEFSENILYPNLEDHCINSVVHENLSSEEDIDIIPALFSGFPIVAWEYYPLDQINPQLKEINGIFCNEDISGQKCISKEYCMDIADDLYEIKEFIWDDFSDSVFKHPYCGPDNCYYQGYSGFFVDEKRYDDWQISGYSCFVRGLSDTWNFNYK